MSEIENTGAHGTLSAIQLDVTDEASIRAAVRHVEVNHGKLDVLINNAGTGCRDPDLKTRLTQCLAVNAVGSALVAEAFRPLLLRNNNPYSIYVSSGAGSTHRNLNPSSGKFEFDEAYRVSKAAQNMIAVREHIEYGPQGLKVLVMSPGCVVSNIRGNSEDERNAWGAASDPDVAGNTILEILLGKRDSDLGKFVVKDGLYAW
ncbi:hypothetical protein LTR70_007556 [Exophiala xenobiotica]|uniref:Uncharacterized protein n=1 Tax=Lithohypha guttulata TaxID=1690604 RepID=A0ABR0K7C5_9EURO|nr:hypothetical protein LTR24_005977 [Lithohypha guttulata]KAK5313572.1 hypothetical protein LTR70_007556 [Exophiala xenobiotica]